MLNTGNYYHEGDAAQAKSQEQVWMDVHCETIFFIFYHIVYTSFNYNDSDYFRSRMDYGTKYL